MTLFDFRVQINRFYYLLHSFLGIFIDNFFTKDVSIDSIKFQFKSRKQ